MRSHDAAYTCICKWATHFRYVSWVVYVVMWALSKLWLMISNISYCFELCVYTCGPLEILPFHYLGSITTTACCMLISVLQMRQKNWQCVFYRTDSDIQSLFHHTCMKVGGIRYEYSSSKPTSLVIHIEQSTLTLDMKTHCPAHILNTTPHPLTHMKNWTVNSVHHFKGSHCWVQGGMVVWWSNCWEV